MRSPLPVHGGVAAREGQSLLQGPLRVVELLVGDVHVAGGGGGIVGFVEVQPLVLPGWGQLVGRSSVRARRFCGLKGIEPG